MNTVTTSSPTAATEIPTGTRLLSDAAAKLEAAFRIMGEAASYLPSEHGAIIQKFSERVELEHRLLRRIVFAQPGWSSCLTAPPFRLLRRFTGKSLPLAAPVSGLGAGSLRLSR